MRKRGQTMQNCGGKQKARPGTRALALVATFSLVASMCPGVAALAFASGQLATGSVRVEEQALSAQAGDEIEVTKDTHSMKTGTYKVTGDVTIEPDDETGNGIQIAKGAKVLLYIEEGATLTVTGKNAEKNGAGRAAILLPEGATLTVAGEGTLNATGGKAATGSNGGKARRSATIEETPDQMSEIAGILHAESGNGGKGGNGGGGAGAGIGTDGGSGGDGGTGGIYRKGTVKIKQYGCADVGNTYGYEGAKGSRGSVAQPAGALIVTGKVTVNAKGGAAGKGGKAGKRGTYVCARLQGVVAAAGTSGGGGGGGGGSAADGIGSGGTGGGGGGGGASANVISGGVTFGTTDIDDLWSHGGSGGSSTWGGNDGANGDEGASQALHDTDASKKYAKKGGEGGSCEEPAPAAFYTYKDSDSSDPKCTSTSGNGVTRGGTYLGALETFKNLGGYAVEVVGGTFTYDGKPHGASVKTGDESKAQSGGTGALRAQAEGDAGVSYSVAYYDIDGNELGSEPVMPGLYAAVASFTGEGISGNWIEPVSIGKRQVAKPAPAELQFQCVDWATGEGVEQEAFPALDETDCTFVSDAETAGGSESLKSAKAAGNYQACFKLKDPSTCQWEGESQDSAEAWVPWSIELAPFDPNDPQVTYWGTAYDNAVINVDYTGEPIWVRPWWTPAKATDGRFPEWLTHWGSEDRPTTDKRSACVMYFNDQDGHEGLVGYHENADGSLEPVTGDQVYAWMFGVDVSGEHVTVEAGDKVWYKTGEDGWKVPLAVQGEEPEGAEGYVVARDYAYVTHLGVMDPGTYQAYAYFDVGAGFAPTSLAEATVEVKPTDNAEAAAVPQVSAETEASASAAPKTGTATKASTSAAPKTGAATKASTSAAPKTGDLSPFAMGSIAIVGLLSAGGVALSLARRRR